MELKRLRLENFRQFAETEIEFGPGITGIIGPNGSGKTTLLEAIAWAIYGVEAVRGDKESIRRFGAPTVARGGRVEFQLEHMRTRSPLRTGPAAPGRAGRRQFALAFPRSSSACRGCPDEFFTLLHRAEGARGDGRVEGQDGARAFRARVLGYERLELAQERVRERRNDIANVLKGLEAGLPDKGSWKPSGPRCVDAWSGARGGQARAAQRAAGEALAKEEPR
jgi:exonuclease SbcC